MATENETKTQEIYGAELEEGAIILAENLNSKTWLVDKATILVLCSIAISLKKLAEEANAATANMPIGEVKQK